MFLDSNGYEAHFESHNAYLHGKARIPCISRQVDEKNHYCEYVQSYNGCLEMVRHFNYLELFACHIDFGPSMQYIENAIVVLISCIILLIYAFPLFMIARFFELPNVITIRNHMQLNDYTFGATLLTFVLSLQISATYKFDSHGIYTSPVIMAQIYGSVLIILCIGVGLVCLRSPFILKRSFVVYDLMFLLIGFIYFGELSRYNRLSPNHTSIILFIYIVYLCGLMSKGIKALTNYKQLSGDNLLAVERNLSDMRVLRKLETNYLFDYGSISTSLFSMLFEWWITLTRYCSKWLVLASAPIWLILSVCIPVVDISRTRNGWNKYTDCLSVLALPILFYVNTTSILFLIFCIPCGCLCLILFLLTNNETPPSFHLMFAYLSLAITGCLIYMLVDEMHTLLLQLSTYLKDWKADMIALSISAVIGNVPVFVMTWNLSTYGYYELAWGLLYGLIIYRVYITWTLLLFQQRNMSSTKQQDIRMGSDTVTAMVFVYIVLFFQIISFGMTGLKIRRSHGVFLFIIYFIYTLFLYLGQFEVIHPYGTGHALSGLAVDDDADSKIYCS